MLHHSAFGFWRVNMYSCQLCSKSYGRPQEVRRHMMEKHWQRASQMSVPNQVPLVPPQAPPPVGPQVVPPTVLSQVPTVDLTFKHPFTMTVAGPTSCGKSTWLSKVLQSDLIQPAPWQIIWCYREWQPLYSEMMQQMPNVRFAEGIQVPDLDSKSPHLIVLDDLMTDATKNKDVSNMFTVGSHHKNMSIICLLHNVFYQGKENRTMSLNSHYLVLFKNPRDQLQMSCLARQMYPRNTAYFMDRFQKATSMPYGCLVVDLKQDTPDQARLKSGSFPQQKEMETSPPGLQSQPIITQTSVRPSIPEKGITDDERCTTGHFKAGHQAVNISRNNHIIMYSCDYCGKFFQTQHFVDMHQQLGCDVLTDDLDEDDPSAWDELLEASYKKHDDLYEARMETLQEEEDIDKNEADSRVSQELRPKYCRSLTQLYKQFISQMHALNNDGRHKEIMKTVDWYMQCKGYEFDKAVDITMRKKRRLLENIVDEAQDEAETAAETDDDSDTDDDDSDTDDDDDDDDDEEEEEEDRDTDDDDDDDDDADDDEEEEEEEEEDRDTDDDDDDE